MQVARTAKLPITGHTLSATALNIRDRLLREMHDETSRDLLKRFRATPAWVTGFVRRTGLRTVVLHGKAGAVKISDVSGGIADLRAALTSFKADNIFNMDETGLFFKLFPKRTYILPGENKHLLRGTKEMGAKDRVTAFVCTNATGSLKIPMAIIGKSANPRCFRKGPPAVPYFNQANAWADTVVFKKWFSIVFLPFIRKVTSEPVALVMENYGPHRADLLDYREQVEIFSLPPNCTSKFQPMDMGVIAAFKLRYRRLLLSRITANIEECDNLRAAAKHLKAGMKGLDEGYDPHMLDVADLVHQAWEQITEKTIARCWMKADILPRAIHGALRGIFGKFKQDEKVDEEHDGHMRKIIDDLRHLKLSVSPESDFANRIDDVTYEDVEDWVCVETNQTVQTAIVEEVFDSIENISMSEIDGDCDGMDDAIRKDVEQKTRMPMNSATKILQAFKEVEIYVDNVGETVVSDAIRRAKRALLDAFHRQTKKRKRQTLMVEYFQS